MKRNILIGAALLAIGLIIGVLCSRRYFRSREPIVQKDTIVVYDTLRYSRLDLKDKTYQLTKPKVGTPKMVFIPEYSTDIIYRDSIRYVTLPRQYFYTKVDDAEIWHSGIDSTIDSLNVVRKTQEITKATQTVTHRNALTFGIESSYLNTFSIPIYLEYERMLHKNVGIYGRINYDLQTKMFGAGIGAKVSIGW